MDAGPEIGGHSHHHHTGRQWVDIVLGVSVVVISLISLALAAENGQAMKRLVAANSWPFVMTGVSNGNDSGARYLQLLMENKGVGPAKIETLEVLYRGHAVPDAETLAHTILGPDMAGRHIPYTTSSIVGNVLSSKETVNFLTINDKTIPPQALAKLSDATKDIRFRNCYCSVFDDCWVLDTSQSLKPVAVRTCPTPKGAFSD